MHFSNLLQKQLEFPSLLKNMISMWSRVLRCKCFIIQLPKSAQMRIVLFFITIGTRGNEQ